jgi:hypothetical protein
MKRKTKSTFPLVPTILVIYQKQESINKFFFKKNPKRRCQGKAGPVFCWDLPSFVHSGVVFGDVTRSF